MATKLRSINGGGQPPKKKSERSGKKLLPTDRFKIREVVRELVLSRTPDRKIHDLLCQPSEDRTGLWKTIPQLGSTSAKKYLEACYAEMIEQDGQETVSKRRAIQINRLERHIQRAAEKFLFGPVANLELLLARITGTLEPERIVHSFAAGEALAASLSSRPDEEIRALMEEQLEVEHKARQFDVLTVEGKLISPPELPEASG